ncbi:hypothetical protein FOXYSP1_16391 [Fusarium oxysporum f. sp. phaseoli]
MMSIFVCVSFIATLWALCYTSYAENGVLRSYRMCSQPKVQPSPTSISIDAS